MSAVALQGDPRKHPYLVDCNLTEPKAGRDTLRFCKRNPHVDPLAAGALVELALAGTYADAGLDDTAADAVA